MDETEIISGTALRSREQRQSRHRNPRYKRASDDIAQDNARKLARWAWHHEPELLWMPSTAVH